MNRKNVDEKAFKAFSKSSESLRLNNLEPRIWRSARLTLVALHDLGFVHDATG